MPNSSFAQLPSRVLHEPLLDHADAHGPGLHVAAEVHVVVHVAGQGVVARKTAEWAIRRRRHVGAHLRPIGVGLPCRPPRRRAGPRVHLRQLAVDLLDGQAAELLRRVPLHHEALGLLARKGLAAAGDPHALLVDLAGADADLRRGVVVLESAAEDLEALDLAFPRPARVGEPPRGSSPRPRSSATGPSCLCPAPAASRPARRPRRG